MSGVARVEPRSKAARASRMTPHLLAASALLAWGWLPGEFASGTPLRVREALRNDLPNRADYDRIERGYYEELLDAGRRFDAVLASSHGEKLSVEHGRLTLRVADMREYVLRPNMDHDPGRRIPWSTNAIGMRDREYPRAKPAGTYRIALAGDSIASGWGVRDGEGFEPRLERALDARSRAQGGPAVEVLNFAVPGHGPGQRWDHVSRLGWAFHPDLVVFEATPADLGWDERRLRVLLTRGVGFDAPVYREVLKAAGVRAGLDTTAYRVLLKPLREALLSGVYRAVVADCRSRGVPAIFVMIPRVGKPVDPAERRGLLAMARSAGFSAVIDACDAYQGADPRDLAVSPNDFHPNAKGHARIARRLASALNEQPVVARLWQDQEHGREPGSGQGSGPERPGRFDRDVRRAGAEVRVGASARKGVQAQ